MQILLQLPSFCEVTTESNWHRKGKSSIPSRLGQVKANFLDCQNTAHDLCGYWCFCSTHWFEPINKKLWDYSKWKYLLNTAKKISSNHSSFLMSDHKQKSSVWASQGQERDSRSRSCPGGILQWPTQLLSGTVLRPHQVWALWRTPAPPSPPWPTQPRDTSTVDGYGLAQLHRRGHRRLSCRARFSAASVNGKYLLETRQGFKNH